MDLEKVRYDTSAKCSPICIVPESAPSKIFTMVDLSRVWEERLDVEEMVTVDQTLVL